MVAPTPQSPAPVAGDDAKTDYEQAKRDFNRMRDDGSLPSEQPVEAIGAGREEMVTPWEDAAEAVCAEVLKRGEATCRKVTDDLYEGLLISVQDYLRENVTLNLSGELDRAYKYESDARDALVEVAKAVGVSFVDSRDGVERQKERILAALSPASPARTPMGGQDYRRLADKVGSLVANKGTNEEHEAWLSILRAFNGFRQQPAAPTPMGGEVEALRRAAKRIYIAGHNEGWTGNQQRRDVAHVDAEKGWFLFVTNGALDKALAASSPSPAQGGSELREAYARAIADGYSNGYEQYDQAPEMMRLRFDMAADAVLALSASPQPEAGEAS